MIFFRKKVYNTSCRARRAVSNNVGLGSQNRLSPLQRPGKGPKFEIITGFSNKLISWFRRKILPIWNFWPCCAYLVFKLLKSYQFSDIYVWPLRGRQSVNKRFREPRPRFLEKARQALKDVLVEKKSDLWPIPLFHARRPKVRLRG